MPTPISTPSYSQVSEEENWNLLLSQWFDFSAENSGGSIREGTDKQDIPVFDIFQGQASSQSSSITGTFFGAPSESPQLSSHAQLEGPALSAFREENTDACTPLFLHLQDLPAPTQYIDHPQDISDCFFYDPAEMSIADAELWALLSNSEVELGACDHSQIATTLPIHDDQPAMNFGEVESSANFLDDPVYDASIGIEHHSQVVIGPPSHDQQAATDVADDVWLNMPLHGFVGYERIDADHRIIPHSRAFRAIRRNSSNPPNGRGSWKRRTRPAKYSCPVAYCGDAFTTKERLKTHYNRFHAPPEQQTRYSCSYCNEYDTSYKDDLRRHEQRCPERVTYVHPSARS